MVEEMGIRNNEVKLPIRKL